MPLCERNDATRPGRIPRPQQVVVPALVEWIVLQLLETSLPDIDPDRRCESERSYRLGAVSCERRSDDVGPLGPRKNRVAACGYLRAFDNRPPEPLALRPGLFGLLLDLLRGHWQRRKHIARWNRGSGPLEPSPGISHALEMLQRGRLAFEVRKETLNHNDPVLVLRNPRGGPLHVEGRQEPARPIQERAI